MLVIRMTRVGAKKKPYYRVVVTEARTARESSFIENVGTYYPRAMPARVEINKDRLQHWMSKGAKPSASVRTLLQKHVTRDLGAIAAAAEAAGSAQAGGTAPASTAEQPVGTAEQPVGTAEQVQ